MKKRRVAESTARLSNWVPSKVLSERTGSFKLISVGKGFATKHASKKEGAAA